MNRRRHPLAAAWRAMALLALAASCARGSHGVWQGLCGELVPELLSPARSGEAARIVFSLVPPPATDATVRVAATLISADAAITQVRLKLALAAKIVLARVLRLMGMSTPEQM